MDKLWMDIRYSFRTLAKNPGFAFVAILVLALGIGATTAIFSVVNAVLIRPLPYQDPARLVAVSSVYRRAGVSRTVPTVSLNQVEHWREQNQSLESIGSFVFSAMPVNVGTQSLFLVTIGADPEFLDTLGIRPMLGRNLPGRGSKLKDSSVLISHRLWVSAFNSDPQVIGRGIGLDGSAAIVIGVLPATFQFPRSDASYSPEDPDILFPVANIADTWGRDSTQWFAIGRLKAGVSMANANADLKTITERMAASDPNLRGLSVHLSALDAETTGSVRPALLLTLGISIVLLMIACTNIMNLLFSRAAQRGREMAVRKAVGATAGRLVRQMLTESACLTFLAGAIGLVLARFTLDALVALSPAHLPVSGRVEIDWTVLGFAFLICAGAAILAGVLPALHRSRQTDTLISAGTRSSASRALLNFQRALMVTQIALGVGLLAAAGLLAHSLFHLSSVDPGFRTQDTLAFEVAFPAAVPMRLRGSISAFSKRRAVCRGWFPPAGSPIRRPKRAAASSCRSPSPVLPPRHGRSAIFKSPARIISQPPASHLRAAATSPCRHGQIAPRGRSSMKRSRVNIFRTPIRWASTFSPCATERMTVRSSA